MKQQSVSAWETGEAFPERATLVKLGQVLGVAPSDLDPALAGGSSVADEHDYNSRIARMPDHVRRTIDDLIRGFEAQLEE